MSAAEVAATAWWEYRMLVEGMSEELDPDGDHGGESVQMVSPEAAGIQVQTVS